MDLSRKLADHIASADLPSIPKKAQDRAKLSILDTVATMIGGSPDPIASKIRAFALQAGGTGEARVVVTGEALPAPAAALVNGTMARILDFDDTMEIARNGCHASAYDVPPALALAERDPTVTGREFLTAVAVATDVHTRLARSVLTNCTDTGRDNGVSVFGATAASAKLLRLDTEQILNAFGIAYAQAAGEMQMYEETAHTVSLQQGLRARTGVEAALMTKLGLTGPRQALDGKYGFFRAFEPKFDARQILDGLGEEYVGIYLSFKRYPGCRSTHTPVDAMLDLREKEGFKADDIEAIRVRTAERALLSIAEPKADKWDPKDSVTARLSLPYTVALAAVKGAPAPRDFRLDALGNQDVRRIMALTTAERSPEIEARHPFNQNAPAEVIVTLKGGRTVSRHVEEPYGHPARPASLADGEAKLRLCNESADRPFSDAELGALSEAVASLDKAPDLRRFFAALFPARRRADQSRVA